MQCLTFCITFPISERNLVPELDDSLKSEQAKRRGRAQSTIDCSCDHHNDDDDKPNLPWLPKRVRFSGNNFDGVRPIPSLLPLDNNSSNISQPTATITTQNDNGDAETLRTQIRLNTEMMSTVENLRKDVDKLAKERDFFKMKFDQAIDQVTYLKKKVNKTGQKENVDPNEDSGPSRTAAVEQSRDTK